MNKLMVLWHSVFSSPTWLRDRATLFSGGMVGLTALILNAVLLLGLVLLTQVPESFEPLLQQFSFGELMGPMLLTGVVSVLTLIVPLRLTGLLMGPRLFRYFDQIVLSGISPLQFIIGRVVSQNLYLLLVLFLLLPWLILVLALGGIDWPVFLGNLFLVWLYCMMLAALMAWLCLYMPEWAAMGVVIGLAAVCCGLGMAPLSGQPIVFTPLPAFLQPLFVGYGSLISGDYTVRSYFSIFLSCVGAMSAVLLGALLGLHLGPLWGLVRENSTFGEVVYAGDSKLKRRLRIRYHIQRPSEIAFFYQNRDGWLQNSEGLIRWSVVLAIIVMLALPGWLFWKISLDGAIATAAGKISLRFGLMPFAITAQFLHGVTLILAVILFSQGVNTTLQRIPFAFGWRIRVSTLDWAGFLLVLVLSTIVCLRLTTQLGPHLTTAVKASIEELGSISPDMAASLSGLRPEHVSRDVTLITGACAVTVYLLQRLLCLVCWLKTMAASITAGMWFGCFCMAPAMVGSYMFHAVSLFPQQQSLGRQLALLSPLMAWMERFNLAPRAIGNGNLLAGFFGLQLGLWVLIGLLLFRRERQLRIKLAIWQSEGDRMLVGEAQ